MPTSSPSPDKGIPADLPPPELDLGVISSGLCTTSQAQEAFDRDQAGKPPAAE